MVKMFPHKLKRYWRSLISLLVMAAIMAAIESASSAGQNESTELPRILRSGFLAKVIADVDPRDAQATLEIMTREVSRNLGLNTSPQVVLYPDTGSMTEAVRKGELDMVSMPTIDYLRIRDVVSLVPAFVALHKEGVGMRFVVIANRASGIRSISQLKGKTLLALSPNKQEPAHVWLNLLLLKEVKRDPAIFFSQVKEVDKVSKGIMGVFFRQADAALVTRAGLDAARLLNPQMDRQLVVIAESRDLSDGITCFPASMPERTRHVLSRAVMQMSTSTAGRQLFTIFQTNGVIPFRWSYVEGLEALLKEESSIRGKWAGKR